MMPTSSRRRGLRCGTAAVLLGILSCSGESSAQMQDYSPGRAAEHFAIHQQSGQCGIDVVYAVLRLQGREVNTRQIRSLFDSIPLDRGGVSLAEFSSVLKSQSCAHRAVQGRLRDVLARMGEGEFLVMPNEQEKHFFLLVRTQGDKCLLYDPPDEIAWLSLEHIESLWSGRGLHIGVEGRKSLGDSHWPVLPVWATTICGIVGICLLAAAVTGLLRQAVRRRRDRSAFSPERSRSPRRPSRRWIEWALIGVGITTAIVTVSAGLRPWHTSEAPRAAESEAVTKPTLVLSPDEFAFGPVPEGKISAIDCVIKNQGSSPVEVAGLYRSCGCLSLDTDVQTLEPGEQGRLSLSLDSEGMRGRVAQTAFVVYRLAGSSQIQRLTVPVSARIISPFRSTPPVIDFGSVVPGKTYEEEVRIFTETAPALGEPRLSQEIHTARGPLSFGPGVLSVALQRRTPTECIARIVFRPETSTPRGSASLQFHSESGQYTALTRLLWDIQREMKLSSQAIALTAEANEVSVSDTLEIIVDDPSALDHLRLDLDSPEAIAEIVRTEGHKAKIAVRVTRPERGYTGPWKTNLRLWNRDENLSVPIMVYWR